MNPAIPATAIVVSVELRPKGTGNGVFATAPIEAQEAFLSLNGPECNKPRRHTIQVDAETHLDEDGFVDGYLNHGCDPNAFVDFSDPNRILIRALRPIEPGEEVRINYCATEEDMAEVFTCDCGSPECYGSVSGYVHLDEGQRRSLAGLLSPFLRGKFSAGSF